MPACRSLHSAVTALVQTCKPSNCSSSLGLHQFGWSECTGVSVRVNLALFYLKDPHMSTRWSNSSSSESFSYYVPTKQFIKLCARVCLVCLDFKGTHQVHQQLLCPGFLPTLIFAYIQIYHYCLHLVCNLANNSALKQLGWCCHRQEAGSNFAPSPTFCAHTRLSAAPYETGQGTDPADNCSVNKGFLQLCQLTAIPTACSRMVLEQNQDGGWIYSFGSIVSFY